MRVCMLSGQMHHIRKAEERIQELNELIEDNEETLRDRCVCM